MSRLFLKAVDGKTQVITPPLDGTSVTVASVSESTADGGDNIVTFSDGTTLTVKNGSKGATGATGAKGATGATGAAGYTPVKGVDYYTEEERQEFEAFIADELAQRSQLEPEYADSVDECTDTTKLYVLPDGYIYAYIHEGGWTNLVPTSTDADGAVYNDTGYMDGYALYYSTWAETAQSGFTHTGFIPYTWTDTLRMSGVTWGSTNRSCIMFYDQYKKPLGNYLGNGYCNGAGSAYSSEGIDVGCMADKSQQSVTTDDSGVTTFNMTFVDSDSTNTSGGFSGRSGAHIKYVRISAVGNGADMVVTVNEEISEEAEGGYQWRNTGLPFVPADYEDRIVALEEDNEMYGTAIEALQQEVTDIVAGNTEIAANTKFDPSVYDIPVLYLTGDTTGMSKDVAVTLDWVFGDNSGSCTLKWQGSSSIAYPKKNYTIKLDSKIDTGWGSQKKYCLKANWIDHSHARNIITAKLWGQMVASRSGVHDTLESSPNYGAVDGYPIVIMLNGEFHGLYTWNIPKDMWTFAMGDGTQEAIICANYDTPAVNLRVHSLCDGSDHELEEVTDEDDAAWVAESLNNIVDLCVNSYGADLDTTIAQYMDWNSAIDYLILTVLIDGRDMVHKNYIMVTYDGSYWIWSAYDMDCTYGLKWDGSEIFPANAGIDFAEFRCNRVMELVYRFKTDALKARYAALRESVLSEDNISVLFENFTGSIPSRLFAEEVKTWPTLPNTSVSNVDQILRWLHRRLAITDKWIEELPEQETPVNPANRSGNVVTSSIDSTGVIFNATGYKDGYTINISSDGVESEDAVDGCCITGFIPVTTSDVIKVTTDSWNISPTNSRVIFYNSSFEPMAYYTQHGYVGLFNDYANKTSILDKSKQSVTYGTDGMTTLNIAYGAYCTDLAYIRIRGVGNGVNMVVTLN